MKKCGNCYAEISDDALFCHNCGRQFPSDYTGGNRSERIFCTECGKAFSGGEAFCDVCGTSLRDGTAPNQEAAPNWGTGSLKRTSSAGGKRTLKKMLLPASALLLTGVLGFGAYKAVSGLFSDKDVLQSKVLYVKNDTLYLADLTKPGEREKIARISWPEKYRWSTGWELACVSPDQSCVFFAENYEEESGEFDLCRVSCLDIGEKEEIASGVSSFEVLQDNSVLYMKNESLYYCDGEKNKKIGKNVEQFAVNPENKNAAWTERRDADADGTEYNLCWQNLSRGNAVTLENGIRWDYIKGSGYGRGHGNTSSFYRTAIQGNTALDTFLIEKGDNIYRVKSTGDREKLVQGQFANYWPDVDAERFYFMRHIEEKTFWLKDFIYDADNEMTEEDWSRVNEVNKTIKLGELCYYDKGEISSITKLYQVGQSNGNGNVIEYLELDMEAKISWSEYKTTGVWGANTIVRRRIRVGDERMLSYGGEINLDGYTLSFLAHEDGQNEVTWLCHDPENFFYEDGFIESEGYPYYKLELDGERKGTLEKYDSDVEYGIAGTKKGFYYMKDFDGTAYGDLYCDEQKILTGLHWKGVKNIRDKDSFLCCTDHDEEYGCSYVSYHEGKVRDIGDEIIYIQYREDGSALAITDYDWEDSKGSFAYFDGNELITIDEDVSYFIKTPENSTDLYSY